VIDREGIMVTTAQGQREFSEFYDEWRNPIRRALAIAVGDITLADEAVDEAMTRAVESWDKISGYERPEGWVYRVGLNWWPWAVSQAPVRDPDPTRTRNGVDRRECTRC